MYNELECTNTLTAIHKTEKKEEIFQGETSLKPWKN